MFSSCLVPYHFKCQCFAAVFLIESAYHYFFDTIFTILHPKIKLYISVQIVLFKVQFEVS